MKQCPFLSYFQIVFSRHSERKEKNNLCSCDLFWCCCKKYLSLLFATVVKILLSNSCICPLLKIMLRIPKESRMAIKMVNNMNQLVLGNKFRISRSGIAEIQILRLIWKCLGLTKIWKLQYSTDLKTDMDIKRSALKKTARQVGTVCPIFYQQILHSTSLTEFQVSN